MTFVPLLVNGLVVVFGAFVLALGGGLLVVRHGRLYAMWIVAGALLLLAAMARNAHVALLLYAPGSTPGGFNLSSTWVSLPIGLVGSTAVALAWLLVLLPLVRPDSIVDGERDGPLAEGGA